MHRYSSGFGARLKWSSRGLDSLLQYRLARIAPREVLQESQPRIAIAFTSSDGTPEERLIFAVLLDAVGILSGLQGEGIRRPSRVFGETRAWVLSDDTGWPYSFRNICEALDIDPERLRRRLTLQSPARALQGRVPDASRNPSAGALDRASA